MGTTANRALRYPAATDRVADGALAIEHLAEDVDLELGIGLMKRWTWTHGDQLGNNTYGAIQAVGTFTLPKAARVYVRGVTMLRLVSGGPAGATIGLQFGFDSATFANGFSALPYVYMGYGLTVTSCYEADLAAGQHTLYVRNGADAANGQAIAISEGAAQIEVIAGKALAA